MHAGDWSRVEAQLKIQHACIEGTLANFRSWSSKLPDLKAKSTSRRGGCSFKDIVELGFSHLGGGKTYKPAKKNDAIFAVTLQWGENELILLRTSLQETREATRRVMTGPCDAGVVEWFEKTAADAVGKVLELLSYQQVMPNWFDMGTYNPEAFNGSLGGQIFSDSAQALADVLASQRARGPTIGAARHYSRVLLVRTGPPLTHWSIFGTWRRPRAPTYTSISRKRLWCQAPT
jgi:hypothetical protein